MPLDDEAALLCGRTNFTEQVILTGPRGDALELALNKRMQVEYAREAGFAVPPTKFVELEPDALTGEIEFPVVFKPAMAVAKSGPGLTRGRSWICCNRAELEAAVASWGGRGPMLLQQFVHGVGEGLFGLATANGVVAWSGHRRLRMMNPHGSGASACATVPNVDEASKASGAAFLARCGWRGLFMIELLRDHAGKLWFMEFNGRAWGSMALARRAGLEYPAWTAQLALNPAAPIQLPPARNDSIVCRHLGREIMHLLFVLRGSKSKALTEWPSFWSAASVLRVGRKDRWYNWRANDRRVFVSDVISTIRDQVFKSKDPA